MKLGNDMIKFAGCFHNVKREKELKLFIRGLEGRKCRLYLYFNKCF